MFILLGSIVLILLRDTVYALFFGLLSLIELTNLDIINLGVKQQKAFF